MPKVPKMPKIVVSLRSIFFAWTLDGYTVVVYKKQREENNRVPWAS